ncbi:MAG: hypothetical protein AAB663_00795 [Patescibacteria group bacterium]
MQLFKNFWMRLKTLQGMIAASAIVIMALFASWCVTNNVDPVVDTARIEAIRTYEVHKARSESAHANIKAIDDALYALDKEQPLYRAKELAAKIPNPSARVRMETFLVLCQIWKDRTDAVLAKYDVYDYRECKESHPGCYKDWAAATHGLSWATYGEESLIRLYRTHGVAKSVKGKYHAVIASDRTLEEEWAKAYPDAAAEKQAYKEADSFRKAEERQVRDDMATFDTAYAGASEVDKTLLVLTETAKATALWWGITTVSIGAFYLFVWWLVSLDGWAKVVAFHNGEIAGVILVRYPFLRPALSGACHKNWRIKKDFWGRAVLCDRMGNRVVVTENTPSSVVAMLFSESLHAHTAFGNEHSDALAVMVREKDAKLEYSDHTVGYYRDEQRKLNIAVAKRNRLLVLVVEAMRKSTEFQRSKIILAIRENLLAKMKKELADDADLWKALKEREEEEGLSEQATQ